MRATIAISLFITLLCCAPMLAKEFYTFPRVDELQNRDVMLLRRPPTPGYDNATGSRNITGEVIFRRTSTALQRKYSALQATVNGKAPLNHTQGAGTITGLATVATSGSYADLSNKPTIPAAQVNSDWSASSGLAQILNKPTIPVACVDIFDGAPGEQGPRGYRGYSGASGTISVGTVTTGAPGTNAVVTNTGTATSAVFDFTIPRGADGDINNITQSQLMDKIDDPSDAILARRAASPATDSSVMFKIMDLAGNTRLWMTAGGALVIQDGNGVYRWAFDPGTMSMTMKRGNGNKIYELLSTGRTTWYRPNGTTAIMSIHTSGRVVL